MKVLYFRNILMIFLLVMFGLSINGAYAQGDKVQKHEEDLMMDVSSGDYDFDNTDESKVNLPGNIRKSAEFINKKRQEFSIHEYESVIKLYMKGVGNSANTTQKYGKGNIMDLGIYGTANTGNYSQYGSSNYIYDRIGNQSNPVRGVQHQINQEGTGLGIYNQGMQTTPLIINQRGKDMKLKITTSPLN